MEERKHLHIAELVQKHELAFKDIKQYYNVITRENVQLIRDLKVRRRWAGRGRGRARARVGAWRASAARCGAAAVTDAP